MANFEFPHGESGNQLRLCIAENYGNEATAEGVFVVPPRRTSGLSVTFFYEDRADYAIETSDSRSLEPLVIPILMDEYALSYDSLFNSQISNFASIITFGARPRHDRKEPSHLAAVARERAREKTDFVAVRLGPEVTLEDRRNLRSLSGYFGSVALESRSLVIVVPSGEPYLPSEYFLLDS